MRKYIHWILFCGLVVGCETQSTPYLAPVAPSPQPMAQISTPQSTSAGMADSSIISMHTSNTPAEVNGEAALDCSGTPSQYDKEKATTLALRDAVIKLAEDFITDEARLNLFRGYVTRMPREELARYIIVARTTGEESRVGYYHVQISAQIDKASLEEMANKLDASALPHENIRVLIVIPETHFQRRVPDPAGETEMIKVFLNNGFEVVDQMVAAEIRYGDPVRMAIKENDYGPAIAIAQKNGAEILVLGEAFSDEAGRIGNMTTCQARIEARVVDCKTTKIYAADAADAGASDLSPLVGGKKAIQTAANELANKIVTTIIRKRNMR